MSTTVLLARPPAPANSDWWERAACLGLDTSLFFPSRGESTAEAEAVCGSCEVRDDCLWFALGDNGRRAEKFGIWGGSSERQRRRLRHEARASAGVS